MPSRFFTAAYDRANGFALALLTKHRDRVLGVCVAVVFQLDWEVFRCWISL